jgi:hypothetical protein
VDATLVDGVLPPSRLGANTGGPPRLHMRKMLVTVFCYVNFSACQDVELRRRRRYRPGRG